MCLGCRTWDATSRPFYRCSTLPVSCALGITIRIASLATARGVHTTRREMESLCPVQPVRRQGLWLPTAPGRCWPRRAAFVCSHDMESCRHGNVPVPMSNGGISPLALPRTLYSCRFGEPVSPATVLICDGAVSSGSSDATAYGAARTRPWTRP